VSRFAAIKSERASVAPQAPADLPAISPIAPRPRTTVRAGKKAVSGYFTSQLSRALHHLALERDVSLQALMGEAFDDLLRKYGRHPFGER
jgi:hypothetical protein